MAIETEIKVRVTDPEAFRRRLETAGCSLLSPRHFEDNYLLDFPDGRMHACMSLVRVRQAGKKAWITYKGPPRPDGVFKTREELEIEVENGSVALEILLKLGMQVSFRYQKYRQEYALSLPGKPGESVHVALDETPIGAYAEFEGSEDGIRTIAAALGFEEPKFLRASYYSLYQQFCSEMGESAGDMVFPADQPVKNLPI